MFFFEQGFRQDLRCVSKEKKGCDIEGANVSATKAQGVS